MDGGEITNRQNHDQFMYMYVEHKPDEISQSESLESIFATLLLCVGIVSVRLSMSSADILGLFRIFVLVCNLEQMRLWSLACLACLACLVLLRRRRSPCVSTPISVLVCLSASRP
jgi:hypothetical protein